MVFVPRKRRCLRLILVAFLVCSGVYLLATVLRLWSLDLRVRNAGRKLRDIGNPVVVESARNPRDRDGLDTFISKANVTLRQGESNPRNQPTTFSQHLKRINRTWIQHPWTPSLRGHLNVHIWLDWCGSTVNDLRRHIHFPQFPDVRVKTRLFHLVHDAHNYGQRVFGYLHPPRTGFYAFAISSDDSSELWLSSDDSPRSVRLIAWVGNLADSILGGFTSDRQFTKYKSQISAKIFLTQGGRYFIEALHKQSSSDDHLLVAWKIPQFDDFSYITSARTSQYIHPHLQRKLDVVQYSRHIPLTPATLKPAIDPQLHPRVKYRTPAAKDTGTSNMKSLPKSVAAAIYPNCSYSPSYLVDFNLTRYQGVYLVHETAVYPDDNTDLRHVEKYRPCGEKRDVDSHGETLSSYVVDEEPTLSTENENLKANGLTTLSAVKSKMMDLNRNILSTLLGNNKELRRKRATVFVPAHNKTQEDLVVKDSKGGVEDEGDDEDNRDNEDKQGNEDNRDNTVDNEDKQGNEDNRDNEDKQGNEDNRVNNEDKQGNEDNRDNDDKRGIEDNRDNEYKPGNEDNGDNEDKRGNEDVGDAENKMSMEDKDGIEKRSESKEHPWNVLGMTNWSHIIGNIVHHGSFKLQETSHKRSNRTGGRLKHKLDTRHQRRKGIDNLDDKQVNWDNNKQRTGRVRKYGIRSLMEDSLSVQNLMESGVWHLIKKYAQEKNLVFTKKTWMYVAWKYIRYHRPTREKMVEFPYKQYPVKCRFDGNLLLNEDVAKSVALKYFKDLRKGLARDFQLKRVVNVEENHDIYKGDRYLIELDLQVKGQSKTLRVSDYVYLPLGEKSFCSPREIAWQKNRTVHVIVPVKNQGKWVQHFIDDMSELYQQTLDANLSVIIVDFNSTDIDIEKALSRSALKRYQLVKVNGSFQRALGIQIGADAVQNPNDILFTCDLHLEIPNNMIEIIRKHCIQGKMAFSPMVIRLDCGFTPSLPYGEWETAGYGLFAIYKSDFDRIGGMNYEEFKTTWGGEDWEMVDRFLQSHMEIERLRVPRFYHFYHSKNGMWGEYGYEDIVSDSDRGIAEDEFVPAYDAENDQYSKYNYNEPLLPEI